MRKTQNSASTLLPLNQQFPPQYGRVNCCANGTPGSEYFSSNSSYSDESYSSDESSIFANWEQHVATDGTLFFIEFVPQSKKVASNHDGKRVEFLRSSTLRMGKKPSVTKLKTKGPTNTRRQMQQIHGKQQKQLQQQQQQQQQHQQNKQLDQSKATEPMHKFSCIKPQDATAAKELELVITAADRYRFGRRSTAVESILGFRVTPFVDQPECLMVLDFVHDMPTLQQTGQQKPVQRGDWFRCLDDIDIRASNVNELLLQFNEPTKVCLKFQGPSDGTSAGSQMGTKDEPINSNCMTPLRRIESFEQFASAFEELLHKTDQPVEDSNIAVTITSDEIPGPNTKPTTTTKSQAEILPFALLILPPECCQLDEHRNSLYFYPEDPNSNFLYKTRGSFLTLNSVFSMELKTQPMSSNLTFNNEPYTVHYRRLEHFLVLFAYARHYASVAESTLRCDELIADMRFSFLNLTFDNLQNNNVDKTTIPAVTDENAYAVSNKKASLLRTFLRNFCDVQRMRLLLGHQRCGVLFEELLRESRLLSLPKEAQLRIFDALSEMEAMDYRSWNDEPLHTHREFFVYGSVLYCGHHLLASQLPVAVRANVEGFIRCRGISDFIGEQAVKSLHVWQEITIDTSVQPVGNSDRYFLSICARNHLLLAVVLKMFDAPDLAPSTIVPPSLFYIEEIQETLDHLIQCGIESLAMFWAVSNKRPEVWQRLDALTDVEEAKSRKDAANKEQPSRLETFIKQRLYTSSSTNNGASSNNPTCDEEAHLCSSLGGSSIYSLTPSEEDTNRQQMPNSSGSVGCDSDSGSDWENFGVQQHGSINKITPVAMTESLYKEINNVLPVTITPGWRNSLYYYIYIDLSNGTVICPFRNEGFQWLREMRSALLVIRDVFLRTKLARRLIHAQDANTNAVNTNSKNDESNHNSFYNKELSTIKEYSTTINVRDPKGSIDGPVLARFTVRGRLFTGKEIYICHHPDVPQNMIEMVFRLSFFSAG